MPRAEFGPLTLVDNTSTTSGIVATTATVNAEMAATLRAGRPILSPNKSPTANPTAAWETQKNQGPDAQQLSSF